MSDSDDALPEWMHEVDATIRAKALATQASAASDAGSTDELGNNEPAENVGGAGAATEAQTSDEEASKEEESNASGPAETTSDNTSEEVPAAVSYPAVVPAVAENPEEDNVRHAGGGGADDGDDGEEKGSESVVADSPKSMADIGPAKTTVKSLVHWQYPVMSSCVLVGAVITAYMGALAVFEWALLLGVFAGGAVHLYNEHSGKTPLPDVRIPLRREDVEAVTGMLADAVVYVAVEINAVLAWKSPRKSARALAYAWLLLVFRGLSKILLHPSVHITAIVLAFCVPIGHKTFGPQAHKAIEVAVKPKVDELTRLVKGKVAVIKTQAKLSDKSFNNVVVGVAGFVALIWMYMAGWYPVVTTIAVGVAAVEMASFASGVISPDASAKEHAE